MTIDQPEQPTWTYAAEILPEFLDTPFKGVRVRLNQDEHIRFLRVGSGDGTLPSGRPYWKIHAGLLKHIDTLEDALQTILQLTRYKAADVESEEFALFIKE